MTKQKVSTGPVAAENVFFGIRKNGSSVNFAPPIYARQLPRATSQGDGMAVIDSCYLTNGARITSLIAASSKTNYLPAGEFLFRGSLVREIP